MKWKQHRLVTGVTVFCLTQNIPATLAAVEGSIFPDKIEQYMLGNWQSHHRKISHLLLLYVLLCSGLFFFINYYGVFYTGTMFASIEQYLPSETISLSYILINDSLNLAFWYFVGAICHLAEDFFCGGIPIWNPNKRIKLFRLFTVGNLSEYIVAYGWCILIILYTYFI